MESTLPVLVGAGAGFLLAVLWLDLMFDVQARRLDAPDGEVRLASIAHYYGRVTIDAFPANRLVAIVMLITVAGSILELWRVPSLRHLGALVLVITPVTLAWRRIVPNAMRLGARRDPLPEQRALARLIWRDHVLCFACIAAFLALHLT